MLIVLSPAKSLDFESPVLDIETTRPQFAKEAVELVRQLREFAPADIAKLMSLSDALAALNVARYASFAERGKAPHTRAALLAFDGDVYTGLDARRLDAASLDFAQRHLRILSGLYGVLRPLDLIQAYRLEMGTRLPNPRGRDLYAWWGKQPAKALRQALDAAEGTSVLVNLASEEYFKAVDLVALGVPVVQPVFQERRAGQYKIVSFSAKRARGAMARFAIERQLVDPQGLKRFDVDGYAFDEAASDASTWYFRREA